MRGPTALFLTRIPTEDEIKDLFDDWIILTSSNTWSPEGINSPCEINTTNTFGIHLMKEDVPPEGLRVCATAERDTRFTEGSDDY